MWSDGKVLIKFIVIIIYLFIYFILSSNIHVPFFCKTVFPIYSRLVSSNCRYWPVLEFYTPCKISATANARQFKFCTRVGHAKSSSCDEWVFPKWAWSGSREQFLHCGLRKFRHSKSSVYRWYTQLDRRHFVYDTYKTMKATRISNTSRLSAHVYYTSAHLNPPTSGLVVQVVSALLRGNWQDFNWHDASHGPSAIAELLVLTFL